jgi:DNA polymerase III delta prime subunit
MNARDRKAKLREAAEKLHRATQEFHQTRKNTAFTLDRQAGRSFLEKAPRFFLGYCALVRAIKTYPEFLLRPSSVVIVVIPRTWLLDDMEYLAEACFGDDKKKSLYFNVLCHPTERNKKRQWDFTPQVQLAYSKVLIFAKRGSELHPEVEAAADIVLNLDPSTDRDFQALARLLGTVVTSKKDNDFLRQQPSTTLDAVFRFGRSPEPAIARLRNLTAKAAASSKALPIETFGEAGQWALRLRRDLTLWQEGRLQWRDMDKGVLVHGPPGTGKTSFAVSLASFLGVPLVAASLAQWQSAGHLGDLLRVMYADFNQARDNTPSILLIDELDSVGDRRTFSGDNAHYCTEVVNALLEAVDGSLGREGVIIVGASNYPHKIDAALLRPGRLEIHFQLSRPNMQHRVSILAFHLPEADEKILKDAARRLRDTSGADLEQFARRVKQRVRLENRSITTTDILAELPPDFPLQDKEIWRICVHEAGHAVLARLFNVGTIDYVEIITGDATSESGLEDAHGRVMLQASNSQVVTETWMRADIALSLGGMIAEELHIGDKSTLSGGSDRSDLASATKQTIKMVGKFGFGRALHVFPDQVVDASDATIFERFPILQREVDALLRYEYERAKQALQLHEAVVLAVANALKKEQRLSGDRLEALLSPLEKPPSRGVEAHFAEVIHSSL